MSHDRKHEAAFGNGAPASREEAAALVLERDVGGHLALAELALPERGHPHVA